MKDKKKKKRYLKTFRALEYWAYQLVTDDTLHGHAVNLLERLEQPKIYDRSRDIKLDIIINEFINRMPQYERLLKTAEFLKQEVRIIDSVYGGLRLCDQLVKPWKGQPGFRNLQIVMESIDSAHVVALVVLRVLRPWYFSTHFRSRCRSLIGLSAIRTTSRSSSAWPLS